MIQAIWCDKSECILRVGERDPHFHFFFFVSAFHSSSGDFTGFAQRAWRAKKIIEGACYIMVLF